mgnify:FL=1
MGGGDPERRSDRSAVRRAPVVGAWQAGPVLALVPDVPPAPQADVERLAEALGGRRVAVLTGAGVSTEAGIPDYRGEGTRARARAPVQYADFLRSEIARRRYWARAVVGWPRFRSRAPGPGHRALAALERAGCVDPVITQNVDRLHQRAGAEDVVELHGALAEVRCLSCGMIVDRDEVQDRFLECNPGFERREVAMAPDGDAELPDELVRGFRIVDCPACFGVLKPHVVFFGESVPRPRVERAFARVEAAEVLLVVGSSLAVFSGYRFVRRAHELGRAVVVLNHGPTRADGAARLKLEARIGDVLPRVLRALTGRSVPGEEGSGPPPGPGPER